STVPTMTSDRKPIADGQSRRRWASFRGRKYASLKGAPVRPCTRGVEVPVARPKRLTWGRRHRISRPIGDGAAGGPVGPLKGGRTLDVATERGRPRSVWQYLRATAGLRSLAPAAPLAILLVGFFLIPLAVIVWDSFGGLALDFASYRRI